MDNVSMLIYGILLCFALTFLFLYCNVNTNLGPYELKYYIVKPKISDVKKGSSLYEYQIQNYVDEVIVPYNKYIDLQDRLSNLDDSSISGVGILCIMIFYLICPYMIMMAFKQWLDSFVLGGIIGAVICACVSWITYLCYKKSRFVFEKFEYGVDELITNFVYDEKNYKYHISKETALNKYLFTVHYNYLLSIEKNYSFRRKIPQTIVCLIFVIFIGGSVLTGIF